MPTPDAARRASLESGARATDRHALIEQLLLAGLDHYFAGGYEQAIHVWTRVFFLDRGHARARAYIERARGALAECLREAEARHAEESALFGPLGFLGHGAGAASATASVMPAESLAANAQAGVIPASPVSPQANALHRTLPHDLFSPGSSSMISGATAEAPMSGMAASRRISRRDFWGGVAETSPSPEPRASIGGTSANVRSGSRLFTHVVLVTLAVILLCSAAYVVVARDRIVTWWRMPVEASIGSPIVTAEPLPLPRASEQTLVRARSLFARGHLHEALQMVSSVGLDDPLRRDADALLVEIERALLETAGLRGVSPSRAPAPVPLP